MVPWLCRGDWGWLWEEEVTQAFCKQYHRSLLERSLLCFSRLRQVKETRQTQGVPSPPCPLRSWKSAGQEVSAQAAASLLCCINTDPPLTSQPSLNTLYTFDLRSILRQWILGFSCASSFYDSCEDTFCFVFQSFPSNSCRSSCCFSV